MVKEKWLQRGDEIANPYMGTVMSTCGSVKRTLAAPADPALAKLLEAYLDVSKSLNADRVDAGATKTLASRAEQLSGSQYAALRDSASKLTEAKDIDAARKAFHQLSDQLITVLQRQPGKGAAQ